MTPDQERIHKRFKRLVKDAQQAGLLVVADAGCLSIRLIPKAEMPTEGLVDLNHRGVSISVDNGCGQAGTNNPW